MNGEPLVIVGIGQEGPVGLGPEARAFLAGAEVLAGGRRHLAFFPDFAGEKITMAGDLVAWIEKLRRRDRARKTVVLATGDPLFYGIGRVLLAAFPKEELRFVPHVGSVALAFARIKESWCDATVVSLHGRPLPDLLPALRKRKPKIAIFTDAANNPAAIARLLRDEGLGEDYDLWVCENLGSAQERVTRWSPTELLHNDFATLNLVVLLAKVGRIANPPYPLLGLPESSLAHRGLITRREVRLSALCYLELHAGDVLWDVGAGSGSVSVEAARLSPALTIFAIDKEPAHLRENVAAFALDNIRVIAGEAPECLAGMDDPDAVFVGGSGGKLAAILDHVLHRLKPRGRLVVSCITLETLAQAWNLLSERGLDPHATSIQLAHSRPLGSLHCLEPEHPIFLVRSYKHGPV
jgi:precorrin-6Y C5,15-methyltransferase (decarboxylating)